MSAADSASAARPRVFVVAGMHRAGTSVVARALGALGIDLGDRLMTADPRMNARGFFEDKDVVAINDALLAAVGADWKCVAPLLDVRWNDPTFAPARSTAGGLLAHRLARSGTFGFKDPRVPRLLPFWQSVFADAGVDDAYVIAVRHPLSVIASLTARDTLDPRRSLWLWLVHLLCALRYTAGRPRVVVDYDRLLADPTHELARMARGLGLPAAALVGTEIATFQREFLAAELRHSHHAADDLAGAALPPLATAAHALAQRLADAEPEAGAAAAQSAADELFERLVAVAPLLDYAGTAERGADEVPRLAGELAWARGSLDAAAAYATSLADAIAVKDADSVIKDGYIDDLRSTLERKERELIVAHQVIERVREHWLGRFVLRATRRDAD